MGGIVGATLAIAGVLWFRTRTTPCPGAVTLEFHPPLAEVGSYRIQLDWEGHAACSFVVELPFAADTKSPEKTGCGMALQLRTQVIATRASIAGLTFAAAPQRFRLQVKRGREPIYDEVLAPRYAPYPTLRAEDKHFCGDRALVFPRCLRGSSECAPFPARCTGPRDCDPKRVCCLTPEWGQDYGPGAASECTSTSSCLARLGHLGCHDDGDCPEGMRCSDTSLESSFSPKVTSCQNR